MVFDMKDRSAQFHTTLVVAAPDKEVWLLKLIGLATLLWKQKVTMALVMTHYF